MFAVAGFLLLAGLFWTFLAPPTSLRSARYWGGAVGWSILTILWYGKDAIPGHRPAKRLGGGSWLVIIAAIGAATVIGVVSRQLADVAASFSWTFYAPAFGLIVLRLFYYRVLYCPRCRATRQALRDSGRWYCGVCGASIGIPQIPVSG